MRAGLIALLLAGCVTTPKHATEEGLQLRLSPASLGGELALAQRITVTRGEDRKAFDAQLEADAQAVRIAAVAMGQTFASLSWDGVKFEERVASQVPAAVTAARILSDVQLAWWPEDAVRAGLPAGYRLALDGTTRSVFRGDAPVATVTYEGTPPAWAHVRLTHHQYGYRLDIESVQP